eukprot:16431224-Heterocapsa_arctica.AAC.1
MTLASQLRRIGICRLANTPDGLSTEELTVKSNEWTVPENNSWRNLSFMARRHSPLITLYPLS